MAEAGAAPGPGGGPLGGINLPRILLFGGVIVVILFAVIFLLIRGCAGAGQRVSGYSTIYSNLDLKDAANVVARLTEMKIPYELQDDGSAISVPKDKADQAKIGLAEDNLPAGGVVGWEIFDESKLGATDFDRRIQLIRAISGELSRTIRRISAVADARVQIVMPETKLFETVKAPVTASVMLRLKPGAELTPAKINGIVHLVASSVENLQPENVTVIDDTGKILTAKGVVKPPVEISLPDFEEIEPEEKIVKLPEEKVVSSEITATTPQSVSTVETKAPLTSEEKLMIRVQAKQKLEIDLAGKAQEILNRFFPPNTVIIKVNVELTNSSSNKDKKLEFRVKELDAVVLVDNRVDISPDLKQATFKAVAAAIGYDRKRGDQIIIQKVPFHLATPPPEVMKAEDQKAFPPEENGDKKPQLPILGLNYLPWLGGAIFLALAVFMLLRRRKNQPKTKFELSKLEEESPGAIPQEPARRPTEIDTIKNAAANNPEKIAEMLKSWLTE